MELREVVKVTELRSEKLQQTVLEALPRRSPTGAEATAGPGAVAANLRRYCNAAGIAWTDEVRLRLGVILRAAFPRDSISGLSD